ncbi:MAG: hypothetical protein EXS16_05465 [Gemmataceae bacterium]|nr:hypothetical protein [Gemmataceae bacterium]
MSKTHNKPEPSLNIRDRIAKARDEGRTQQALDLTRQLYKNDQTEANRELLRQVTLERARQLHEVGSTVDAITVYSNLLTIDCSPELMVKVLQGLTECGAVAQALAVLPTISDTVLRAKMFNRCIDAVVAQGKSGKKNLPVELHAGIDATLGAFAHYETGRDEEARAALQAIGLQSPFLEWKVLLRGLIAYVANDDAKALDNWRRLDPSRVPSQLARGLRAGIDPEFLQAQPASVQKALQAQILNQQRLPFVATLRELGPMLHTQNLAPAFRKVEVAAGVLRRDHPQLFPRLANCFYWAVIEWGHPDDIDRYRRVFGPPVHDPNLDRMAALALEFRGIFGEANDAWQDYLRSVELAPNSWPANQRQAMQAMVWSRMAFNASPKRSSRGKSMHPLAPLMQASSHMKPSAEKCLEKAIEFAPDRLANYLLLFELYRDANKLPKAKKIGQELLKRFPDHAQTLEALSELCMDCKEFKKAEEYCEKAMQANPLELGLRRMLASIRQQWGLYLAEKLKFVEARGQYARALQIWEGAKTPLLAQWAILEVKATCDTRADELVTQALVDTDQRLAVRYALVGESVRAKLTQKQKKRFASDLKAALEQTPTPAEILMLIESAAQQRTTHAGTFHGQKTQENTILKFLEKIPYQAFNESQMERLVAGLATIEARKPWLSCLGYARKHFLKNPLFRLSYVDYYLVEKTREIKTHLAQEHIDDARRLIEQIPRGELQEQFLDQLKEKEEFIQQIDARNPQFMDIFSKMFDHFGSGIDDDEDEFDDENEDEDEEEVV